MLSVYNHNNFGVLVDLCYIVPDMWAAFTAAFKSLLWQHTTYFGWLSSFLCLNVVDDTNSPFTLCEMIEPLRFLKSIVSS